MNLEKLTLLQADILVSRIQLQEIKRRKRMTATSGRKCAELLHKSDPLGRFAKMFMVTSDWDWMTSCMAWKPKATPHGRLLFQLCPQVQTITGTEFLLWPTPQAMDSIKARPPEAMVKQMNGARKGRTKIATLKDAAVYGLEWKGQAIRQGEGELNPQHLEWQMNYPIGWTETEC